MANKGILEITLFTILAIFGQIKENLELANLEFPLYSPLSTGIVIKTLSPRNIPKVPTPWRIVKPYAVVENWIA